MADPEPVVDPDLTVDDVEVFTGGRLSAVEDETQRMLDAALRAARRDVGWHVSPVRQDTLTMDGPGGQWLSLPTKKIVKITSITEDGVLVDSSQYQLPAGAGYADDAPCAVWRSIGRWTRNFGGLVVVYSHGFTSAEAADWRQAILTIVDEMAAMPAVGRPGQELSSKQVDDVIYEWGKNPPMLPSVEPILANYRLLRVRI